MGTISYGMTTNPSRNIIREAMAARKMGFDYLEIGMEIPGGHERLLEKNRKRLLDSLKTFPHGPVGHTAYWSDLWSEYSEVRDAWLSVLKRYAGISASLGCRKMNVHGPLLSGMYKQSRAHKRVALRNFSASMRELVSYANGKGILIVLENMPDPETTDVRDYKGIIDSVPGLGVHVDVGHAFLEGGMNGVRKYLRLAPKRLEHLHFSDNTGMFDEHLGLGQGEIDYFEVMGMLMKLGYGKTATLEIFSGRKDLKQSLKIIRAAEEEAWQ